MTDTMTSTDMPFAPNKPMGGTELIHANLVQALPELTSQVQIMLSRPEQYTLEDKPRILWLQDLPWDPNSAPLKDPSYRTKFNRLVFCSNWQREQYKLFLGIPYSEGIVIKNGVPRIDAVLPKPKTDGKLKFIYLSTPHRGLAILAEAARALAEERQDWELHVYSSLKIYGRHEQDAMFEPLYQSLQQNPCVVYHGSRPHDEVVTATQSAHVYVYPSIYHESHSMAMLEAMMSGCLVITSSLASLPETCGDWAWMFQFDERPEVMIQRTYSNMKNALLHYDDVDVQNTLRVQSAYYQHFHTFESRIESWRHLLETVIQEGTPVEKLII